MSKVAVLMGGSNIHGRMLVEALVSVGMAPSLVIDERGTSRAEKLSQFLENDYDNPPPLDSMVADVCVVDGFDGAESMRALRAHQPDYLVNGGCGIMRAPLLEVSTPINVHPGLLPQYRGLDPVLWALRQGGSVGATVHVMSEGIDEGDILISKPLPWRGAETALQLRLQCMRWGGRLLVEFLVNPDQYLRQVQDERCARYYGAFPPEELEAAERNLHFYEAVDGGNRMVSGGDGQ